MDETIDLVLDKDDLIYHDGYIIIVPNDLFDNFVAGTYINIQFVDEPNKTYHYGMFKQTPIYIVMEVLND